jgi:hypothetical protein
MEAIKNFFTSEKFKISWNNFYNWFEKFLDFVFGKIKYEPIKELLTNPWFWIILLALFLLSLIFRRR